MPLMEVRRGLGAGFGNGQAPGAWLNTLGQQVVMDWYQAMILDGRGYQVRAGTITTPLTSDIEITDAAAEMCADCASGTSILPVYLNVDVEALGGTLPVCAAKSVATVSSAGTAFVPLPLKSDGAAAVSTARVQAAGAVTVTAELATSTLRHFGKTIATAALEPLADHEFRPAPLLVGARCFYVQVAGVTTGCTYFANFDYVELPTLMVNPS